MIVHSLLPHPLQRPDVEVLEVCVRVPNRALSLRKKVLYGGKSMPIITEHTTDAGARGK